MAAPRSSCRVAEVGRLFGFGNFPRHQLRTALQRAPPRLRLRGSDQTLLVWMTRHWPTRSDPTSNESPGPEQRDPRAQISLRAILTPRPSSPASLAGVPSRETESSGPRGVRGSAGARAKAVGAGAQAAPAGASAEARADRSQRRADPHPLGTARARPGEQDRQLHGLARSRLAGLSG